MSIFRKIFGRPNHVAVGNARTKVGLVVETFGGSIVSIPQIDSMGQTATSPNGRYRLVWRDRTTICCEDVGGRYVLLDGAELLVDGAMERPNDGKVADDGTFILNDWGSRDALAGTFMARSEERRVGKECVSTSHSRWSPNLYKKKNHYNDA